MKQRRLTLAGLVCTVMILFGSGCGTSMFTTEKHYHGTPEIDRRLDCLEQRVIQLEAMHPEVRRH
jgi:hypothetical protein